ncbi:alpha-E domain-containing protein [Simiduia curdlanivorans]|uniref:Alpha-E domain-containing protein n=1 Tax=Simiduia curdlanivorans TaxID=1492769 RepID=A0ABV8V635_9GAMM|nr:alpha-E domain-containing protein [Simiduia curdlanivorans]MDN3638720.1 alpha-E domain-containing protein [Simiduia curdlanivorans]
MLSRVAERVYWAARYLERIENTVRLVSVYDQLMFDLPRSVGIGWYNLVTINSAEEAFGKLYDVQSERNVVKFLLGDEANQSSVCSSLRYARENLRTTRDVIPAESWELINELHMFVVDNLQRGIARSERFNFLDGVVKHCQQIRGLIVGCMPRDHVWCFLELGRNIERADMTTRILDAGVRAQIQVSEDVSAINSQQIIWGHVLRSLDATQSYRRTVRASISSTEVARYILEDKAFPRTISHCLIRLEDSLTKLPKHEAVLSLVEKMQDKILNSLDYSDLGEPMKDFLNDMQLDLASVHTSVSSSWFTYE